MLDGTSVVGWFNLISNVGFPTVVALYLLFQYEKRLLSLEKSIEVLGDRIQNKEGEGHDEPASINRKRKAE